MGWYKEVCGLSYLLTRVEVRPGSTCFQPVRGTSSLEVLKKTPMWFFMGSSKLGSGPPPPRGNQTRHSHPRPPGVGYLRIQGNLATKVEKKGQKLSPEPSVSGYFADSLPPPPRGEGSANNQSFHPYGKKKLVSHSPWGGGQQTGFDIKAGGSGSGPSSSPGEGDPRLNSFEPNFVWDRP